MRAPKTIQRNKCDRHAVDFQRGFCNKQEQLSIKVLFQSNKITHNSSNHVHWIGMLILRFSQHHHLPSLPYISTRGVFVISDLFFLLYYRTYLLNPKHFNPIDHLQLRIISNTPRWKKYSPLTQKRSNSIRLIDVPVCNLPLIGTFWKSC